MRRLGTGGATRSTREPSPLPGRGRSQEPSVLPDRHGVTPEDWAYFTRLLKSSFARQGVKGRWDDLLQEGYVAVLRAARSYDPERGIAMRAWITKKMLWNVIDERRSRTKYDRAERKSREVRFLDPDNAAGLSGSTGPDNSLEQDEHVDAEVKRLLELATPRECVILRVVMNGGMMRDAARDLGISKSRATQLMQAFRRKARRDRARRVRDIVDADLGCLGSWPCPMRLECVREWQRVARKEVARRIA